MNGCKCLQGLYTKEPSTDPTMGGARGLCRDSFQCIQSFEHTCFQGSHFVTQHILLFVKYRDDQEAESKVKQGARVLGLNNMIIHHVQALASYVNVSDDTCPPANKLRLSDMPAYNDMTNLTVTFGTVFTNQILRKLDSVNYWYKYAHNFNELYILFQKILKSIFLYSPPDPVCYVPYRSLGNPRIPERYSNQSYVLNDIVLIQTYCVNLLKLHDKIRAKIADYIGDNMFASFAYGIKQEKDETRFKIKTFLGPRQANIKTNIITWCHSKEIRFYNDLTH